MTSEHKQLHHQDIIRITDDEQNVIEGNLTVPKTIDIDVKGIVIFAHGSGSSRHSQRNQYVAKLLNDANIATLLIDLLTSKEEEVDDITREHRFNIKLLAKRLLAATDWISKSDEFKNLKVGYFGARYRSCSCFSCSSEKSSLVYAIVSRGGRPDLASSDILNRIESPTLLIVGEKDKQVIELNEMALKQLTRIEKKKKIVIIPKATHLFEEPGTLEEVAKVASGWFQCFFLEDKK